MEFQKTAFKDLIICTPKVFEDDRGYFFESYNSEAFEKFAGFSPSFVQDNQSKSSFGVLRGLHFQIGKHAQSKLVRVIEGEVLDVVVDLRKEEPTYGKSFTIKLSGINKKQLFVPKGMAHGFITLSDTAIFAYKCDAFYDQKSERGLAYNDPSLKIDWLLDEREFLLSPKDLENPMLSELKNISF
ncbi:dTDP-4-dehydrorhamnose 3,5-epimerase [Dokdonia sp. Dokd-P16]|uniref:dTDP-4-dehydrorhamnose 3,5-epimerase n=1 Tax=Dokdonia sp. Dokd-P16 TaxID=2173169 RepID=UPI000D5498B2|nr:dTDP-4-dehydrorhamnose 3,5-epimerase [Dokdonia sp. Dokd-P16]AWH75125.1 dTDP-4-dehydrorhamnose 3,5-epimerase [Dokdonia sp. Dokd-P16]